MTTSAPDLGLLLDVDGPIASPVTRTVAIQSILDDLVTLAAAGVPIAFITGRSEEFIRERVIEPLFENGLAEALQQPGARMFGVYEKGGTWSAISPEGMSELQIDETVVPPAAYVAAIRELGEREFSDVLFFDETKKAMISVEQRTDVSSEAYLERQKAFDDAAFELAAQQGVGMRHGDREAPDAQGLVPFRIDPTIISTDIESVKLDKDHGARRALAEFKAAGPLPKRWRSVGDSRSDYKMADELHASGYDAAHVDVRPADGILEKDYDVVTFGDLIHDDAGAAFLRECVRELGLES
ncbi:MULTISPECIES: hypothetical protein [unclassified Pseudoclavibacter]|uniref:hypothetical protein n=1 Tax=unclassified Pseudoclavibacter TaxID=2615177 RepID=UPI001BA97C81|nr:hypothetical protein [Pseudoclavibacter sp. Marseille-Q4354]MBS3178846.1 hypothetical protein [Pseudoclavibacter sp. Marseille-Q4354]